MSWLIVFKQLCFGLFLLQLFSKTMQHPPSQGIKGESTVEMIMRKQAFLFHGDFNSDSRTQFSEVKLGLKPSRGTRKRKSQFILDSNEPHRTRRMDNGQSPRGGEKYLDMEKEESNLDFLTIHLQPHLWPWKGKEMNRQTLQAIVTKNTAREGDKERKIEGAELVVPKRKTGLSSNEKVQIWLDSQHRLKGGSEGQYKKNLATMSHEQGHILTVGKHLNNQKEALSAEDNSLQYPSTGKADTTSDENTRMAEEKELVTGPSTNQKRYPKMKVVFGSQKTWDELSKDELFNVLADLKTQGESLGYMNIKVPVAQLKKIVELERSMEQKGWDEVWLKVHDSFGELIWKYWARSIKAQIQQFRLIEGWKVARIGASDDLRTCMKLLQAEEYWPVFSGIKYKTFTETVNLIRKMHFKNDGHDYKELCRLIPKKLLQNRLSRMKYMAQRPDIISHLYSNEELKSKQEKGYDTLLIMMVEETLDMANQLVLEDCSSQMKERKAWNVFAKLFKIMVQGTYKIDEINDTSIKGHKKYRSNYWPSSIESEFFTRGSTPQAHRFKNGFSIALKNLQENNHIFRESMNETSLFKLMKMAGNWSLSDILLGVHNGVDLETFRLYRNFATSHHHPYIQPLKLEKKNLSVKQVYNFQRFLHARMELQKEGKPSSHRPLNSLKLL